MSTGSCSAGRRLRSSTSSRTRTRAAPSAPKRYDDVERLLDGGIEVWTTVNIQHLESLNDRVREVTGVTVRETFPDRLIRDADEIRLVDLSPAALRERIARGLVYPTDQIDRALSGFFTLENLAALRALALHELAEIAAAEARAIRRDASVGGAAAERVLVAIGGRPDSASRLIRAGERLAERSDAALYVLVVEPQDGRVSEDDRAGPRRGRGAHANARRHVPEATLRLTRRSGAAGARGAADHAGRARADPSLAGPAAGRARHDRRGATPVARRRRPRRRRSRRRGSLKEIGGAPPGGWGPAASPLRRTAGCPRTERRRSGRRCPSRSRRRSAAGRRPRAHRSRGVRRASR